MITFQPLIPFIQVRITVTGPDGFQQQQTFASGENLRIGLPGTDGFYKFELRFAPILDDAARAALVVSRRDGTEPEPSIATSPESTVQSGAFTIADGRVVPDAVEPSPKVVLTNGDGVIRNSLCVGFDCPDAPVFGDSTILMMENNTRIKFGDTSNAPFPNNDWEIEANSSSSGGANYLGFNDCGTADNDGGCADDVVFAVEAGVRRNALYVESDGDVGVGTSNPVVDLHIVTGNTPAIRLDQDGSSGFAPQVWDAAGNETNFFIRDVTNGSTLPFRIRPGAPSSAVFIDVDGDVGIGTSSPDDRIDIESSTDTNFGFRLSRSAVQWVVQLNRSTDGTAPNGLAFTRVGTGVREMQLSQSGDLEITGNYFANGTQLNVPDFVFDPNYELMPINALSNFVSTHRHLPDIPAARDIQQTGLNMTDMQLRLLEKVEQLTLYTIQQEETISSLQARLAALEAASAD